MEKEKIEVQPRMVAEPFEFSPVDGENSYFDDEAFVEVARAMLEEKDPA